MDEAGRRAALSRLERGCTTAEGLKFYDSLPTTDLEQLLGTWCGTSLPTGHRLAGLMELLGWYGKRFGSTEVVHPLVFRGRRWTRLVALDPARVPVLWVVRLAPLLTNRVVAGLFGVIRPLLQTRRPAARLRMTQYRGRTTATMVYDAQPINDALRTVDQDTLLGAMDLRGMRKPYLFVLRREQPLQKGNRNANR